MPPRRKDDILDRVHSMYAETKDDLVVALNEAEDQARKWTARRDTLKQHVAKAESLAEIQDLGGDSGLNGLLFVSRGPVDGPLDSMIDRVGKLIAERPGLTRAEIGVSLALKVVQVSGALQALRRAGRVTVEGAGGGGREGKYFPAAPGSTPPAPVPE